MRTICADLEVEILKGHVSSDHVHLFVSCPPHVSPSYLMQRVKGKSSRKPLQQFSHLNKEYWGRHLWTRWFFVASSGIVTDEAIIEYIRTQDVTKEDGGFPSRRRVIPGALCRACRRLLHPPASSRSVVQLSVDSRRHKSLAGNRPRRVEPGPDRSIRLDASLADVYGPTLTFEPEFSNLGYWQSPVDRAAWTFRVEKPGTYTLSIDMACAEGSSGNAYEIRLDSARHRRVVGATGPDWSLYRGVFVAEVRLEPGEHRLEVRSAGPIRQALFDLRAVILTGPRGLN